MLSDYSPCPTLAVADLDRARAFYEGTLGFVPLDEEAPEGVFYSAGGDRFLVYPSAFAGTNQSTAMSFQVDDTDFDDEIANLRQHGIVFETFEAEGIVWSDGIGAMGDLRSVWFSDPDGNILNVESSL